MIFNGPIPQDLGFVDRTDPEESFEPEIMFVCGKKQLGKIIDKCIRHHGFTQYREVLDSIKALGYKYSTMGALTVAVCDMTVPEGKDEMIRSRDRNRQNRPQFKRGFITDGERYRAGCQAWEETTKVTAGPAGRDGPLQPDLHDG